MIMIRREMMQVSLTVLVLLMVLTAHAQGNEVIEGLLSKEAVFYLNPDSETLEKYPVEGFVEDQKSYVFTMDDETQYLFMVSNCIEHFHAISVWRCPTCPKKQAAKQDRIKQFNALDKTIEEQGNQIAYSLTEGDSVHRYDEELGSHKPLLHAKYDKVRYYIEKDGEYIALDGYIFPDNFGCPNLLQLLKEHSPE